jgi:hypothetical protein
MLKSEDPVWERRWLICQCEHPQLMSSPIEGSHSSDFVVEVVRQLGEDLEEGVR